MTSDPITLYKLMTLYMLKKVNFPLSNAQMSEFFLDKGYTNYFTFQQVLNELLDAHLIQVETVRNTSRYEITSEGEEALSFFANRMAEGVTEDIDAFLQENKIKLRNEIGVTADYYRSTNQDYIVECRVREGNSTLIHLEVSVPDKEEAEHMCTKWEEENQAIYAFVMKKLM